MFFFVYLSRESMCTTNLKIYLFFYQKYDLDLSQAIKSKQLILKISDLNFFYSQKNATIGKAMTPWTSANYIDRYNQNATKLKTGRRLLDT